MVLLYGGFFSADKIIASNTSDGELIEDKVLKEALEEDENRPANLDMVLGYTPHSGTEYTGKVSQLNIFSSPLSTDRMVSLTEAGNEHCAGAGDYVSWEEEVWKLTGQARMEMVEELQGPCRRESEVTVYTADFPHHSAATNKDKISGCMEHCEKLGKGRSPPVRTLEEWDWLRWEVHNITTDIWRETGTGTGTDMRVIGTTDISVLGTIWLAATDERVEGLWRDPYPSYDQLNTSVAWPWGKSGTKDTELGNSSNCLQWYTVAPRGPLPDDASWVEYKCTTIKYNISCLKDVS